MLSISEIRRIKLTIYKKRKEKERLKRVRKKAWNDNNKAKCSSYAKDYKKRNPDKIKAQYEHHRKTRTEFILPDGSVKLVNRFERYKILHPDKVKTNNHNYYRRNRLRALIYNQLNNLFFKKDRV